MKYFKEPIVLPDGLTREEFIRRLNINNTESVEIDFKQAAVKSWELLHSMKDPSNEKIEAWLNTIPSYGCGCQDFAREYIQKNPPTFDNFFYWTWKFHDEVDIKTGDKRMSFEEAKAYWSKPSIANMAYNLIADTAKYVKSGFENCSQEEVNKRLSICNQCPHLDDGRCNQCGCFVNIKAILKSSQCPLDKWPSNDDL